MRLTTAICLASTILLAGSASAGTTKGTGGGKSGTVTIGGNAQDGTPTGTADKGTFTFNDTNRSSYTASLDCVRTTGDTTFFSGVIRIASRIARQTLGILPGFTYVYGEFYDSGEPNVADTFELLLINPDGSEDPALYCETDRAGQTYALDSGNLQVKP